MALIGGMNSLSSERASFKRIVDLSASISQLLGQRPNSLDAHLSSPNPTSDVPNLGLSIPDDLLSPIFLLDVPGNIRHELHSSFQRCLNKMQQKYEDVYRRSCQATLTWLAKSPSNMHQLQESFRSMFNRQCISMTRSQVSALQAQIESRSRQTYPSKKTTFNHESTPILETYFSYNAYPSSADRQVLAEKTNMTPRQIEVWFQNHRNRSKGKTLPKLTSDLPLKLALKYLGHAASSRHCDDTDVSTDSRSESDGPDVDDDDDHSPLEDFSLHESSYTRPPHAFPVPYSANCVNNQFPGKSVIPSFPLPIWRRIPAKSSSLPASVDMEALISCFSNNLHLRETSKRAKSPVRRVCRAAWFSSRVTITPPAPLPSLIRTPCRDVLSTSSRRNSSSRSVSSAPRLSTVPARKPAAFLLRKPTFTPVATSSIPYSNNSSDSRQSSSSSLPSLQSRSTSLSSISSDPTTPPLSPVFSLAQQDLIQLLEVPMPEATAHQDLTFAHTLLKNFPILPYDHVSYAPFLPTTPLIQIPS